MFRFIIIILAVVLFLILSLPILFVLWIVGKFNQGAKDRASKSIVQWCFRVVRFLAGTKVEVKGLENLEGDKSVLYVCNHLSYFDIILSYIYLPGITGYLSKKQIQKVPSLNLWMKNIRCLFLDRDDIKQGLETILKAIELVKSGVSVFVFPEGTRNKEPGKKDLSQFKAGCFKIATKSNCDVIPLTIVNSSAIFEDQFPKIKKAKVIIEFGTPIKVSEMTKEEQKSISTLAKTQIEEMYSRNYDELHSEIAG